MTPHSDIREALRELADELRRRIDMVSMIGNVAKVKKRGRNGSACCPFHNEKSPSFHVYGGADSHYHCFGCGAHGDAISFRMQFYHLDFKPALGELAEEYGLKDRFEEITGEKALKREKPAALKRPVGGDRQKEADRRADFMLQLALGWWRRGVIGAGTLVETYMNERIPGYGVPPVSLRFCAAVPESFDPKDPLHKVTWPGMLAGVQATHGPDAGKVRGLHITYLRPDGLGKAPIEKPKRMLGHCWGGAVRLSPILPGKPFFSGEGIETTGTVQARYSDAGTFWAALSLGNLAGAGDPDKPSPFHPNKRRKDPQTGEENGPRVRLPTIYPDFERPGIIVPADCSEAILLCDGDSDPWITRALIRRATRRIQQQGKPVRQAWAHAGEDFNSMVHAGRGGEGRLSSDVDAFGLPALPEEKVA